MTAGKVCKPIQGELSDIALLRKMKIESPPRNYSKIEVVKNETIGLLEIEATRAKKASKFFFRKLVKLDLPRQCSLPFTSQIDHVGRPIGSIVEALRPYRISS